MLKLAGNTRAALLGVLCAIVAFSYALAVSTDGVGDGAAGSRAVAGSLTVSPLDFTNPFMSDSSLGRDLGDAVVLGTFVNYCRAKGGVPPYKFAGSQTNDLSQLTALGLSLAENGLVSGVVKSGVLGSGALCTFKVTVTDSAGTNPNKKAEPFNITIWGAGVFKFAVGPDLGTAIQNQPFQTNLAVLGGSGAKTFAVTNVKLGTASSSLAAVGLWLDAATGALYGKPVMASAAADATLTFTATCTDAASKLAAGRDNTGASQDFSLVIKANPIVTGDVVSTGIAVKLGAAGKDSVKYAGQVNIAGQSASNITGDLTVAIGGYSKSVALSSGKSSSKDTKGSISSKGQVKFSDAKLTLANAAFVAGGTIADGTTYLIPVSVNFANKMQGIETLPFAAKSKSGKSSLTFKLGAAGAPGGSFLVTTASGKDDTKQASGAVADAWKIGFIAQQFTGSTIPAAKSTSSFGGTRAFINLGTAFSDDVGVTESKGKVKSDKVTKADNKVLKLAMDATKGKGSLQTSNVFGAGAANTNNTGLPLAGGGTLTSASLAVGIALGDANTDTLSEVKYAGEGSIVIFAGKSSWSDKHK